MIEVVAAMIRDGERIFICRRPLDKAQGGKWEFPGGKIEPGESGETALMRECREELGVTLAVGEALADVIQEYPGRTVHLTLYAARIVDGTPQRLEHSEMRWIAPEQLDEFDWCAADARLIEQLRGRGMRLGGHREETE